mmetsp:Transcript_22891/g.50039  ORF Transcript_22891/g.50039 Transcript_22891/m.50039 type:complete len:251 (-) Transcript_22891:654-1406(-)
MSNSSVPYDNDALYVETQCTLLGGPFALSVQAGLAIAAVLTLIYKRQTEQPRRPWIVWAFDASKQAFAGLLQHLVNLGFGIAFASLGGVASECAWYLLNFSISVVCGVLILWGAMWAYKKLVDHFECHIMRSGEYGKPPKLTAWVMQLLVWGLMASGEKMITAALVIYPLHSHLDGVAAALERPLLAYPRLELVLVMVAAPIVLNAVFFWLIDSIIMRKRSKHDDSVDRQPLLEDDYCCCPGLFGSAVEK